MAGINNLKIIEKSVDLFSICRIMFTSTKEMTMKNSVNIKAQYNIGDVIESGMHFACNTSKPKAKPCPWSHVEKETRTGKYSNLSLVAK